MKNLILLLFAFTLFWSNSQQVITLCEFTKKNFTYTTNSQEIGVYTWDINGEFTSTPSNTLTIDWSTYEIGTYIINVYFVNSAGCSAESIQFVVFITECNESFIYTPNAFTPDGDVYNNVWKPITYNINEGMYIIFNRWGEIIYESYNLNIGWPGTYGSDNGLSDRTVQDGVYIYVIEYVNAIGIKEKLTGHITLLR